jgi:hypothetical protein
MGDPRRAERNCEYARGANSRRVWESLRAGVHPAGRIDTDRNRRADPDRRRGSLRRPGSEFIVDGERYRVAGIGKQLGALGSVALERIAR